MVGVPTEKVLLRVGRAEDVQTGGEHGADDGQTCGTECDWVRGQVAGLRGVKEGQPGDIAKSKHEAQAVGSNVHHGQDTRLHVLAFEHVVSLHSCREQDAVGNKTIVAVLLGNVGAVEQDPARQAGAHLEEGLDIDLAEKGPRDARVELTADVEVVDHVASVATLGKLAQFGVAGLDREALCVDPNGDGVSQEDVGCQQLQVVIGHELPNNKVGALEVRSESAGNELNDRGVEGWCRVRVSKQSF